MNGLFGCNSCSWVLVLVIICLLCQGGSSCGCGSIGGSNTGCGCNSGCGNGCGCDNDYNGCGCGCN